MSRVFILHQSVIYSLLTRVRNKFPIIFKNSIVLIMNVYLKQANLKASAKARAYLSFH